MPRHRLLGAFGLVWHVARATALTLALLAAGQPPAAALHAAAAGAGTSTAGPYLYWTTDGTGGGTVGRAWLDGSHVDNTFIVGGTGPVRLCGVAIAGTYLYWGIDTSSGSPTLGRARLDGTAVNPNFLTGAGNGPVCGVAVARGLVYWARYANGNIGQASLDGSFVNENFITGLTSVPGSYPCGACDPDGLTVTGGYIYWGGFHAIGRARLDGTDVDPNFINGGMYWPSDVKLMSKYIYWSDMGGNIIGGGNHPSYIGRARLDGTGVQRHFITGVDGVCAIAVTDKYIYFAQYGVFGNYVTPPAPYGTGGTIGRANLDGSGVQPRFITGLQGPCGLAVGP